MFNVSKQDVQTAPFPHILKEGFLDQDFYERLKKDFPGDEIFEGQRSQHGAGTGSRTGQGFDIYRGDAAYENLIKTSEAWKEFDAYINSRAFIETFNACFGDRLQELGCKAQILPEAYDHDYIEGREVMPATASLGERVKEFGRRLTNSGKAAEKAAKLFTRLDIHRAMKGYAKDVHCDRANRLCSLILYFCDADKAGFTGGDLTIHAHVKQKPAWKHERHPDPKDAPVVATVHPKENVGVFFPCSNNSYHGVTQLTSHGGSRDYLYINISGITESLW